MLSTARLVVARCTRSTLRLSSRLALEMGDMRIGRLLGASRGQSFVELAISLPLVMMLIMGVIDFGWALYAQIQVASASYEGARAGAMFSGGDITQPTSTNDVARAQAVRNAIYDPTGAPSTNTLGMLNAADTYNFNVTTDVQISTPDPASDPYNTTRVGQQLWVTVTFHQPIWFTVLPGISNGRINVSTTTKVRIQ